MSVVESNIMHLDPQFCDGLVQSKGDFYNGVFLKPDYKLESLFVLL